MIDLKVEANEKEIKELIWKLRNIPDKIPVISARVANRTVSSIKTEISKITRKEYIIKSKMIKDTISNLKATTQNPTVKLKLSGNRLPLYQFKTSPSEPRPQNPPKAYKAKVKKTGGFKRIQNAFVADIKQRGISERLGKSRTPTKPLYGPSVPEMVGTDKVSTEVLKKAQETFDKRLKHEIEYELEKMK